MKMRTYECNGFNGCPGKCIITTTQLEQIPEDQECYWSKKIINFREVDLEKTQRYTDKMLRLANTRGAGPKALLGIQGNMKKKLI